MTTKFFTKITAVAFATLLISTNISFAGSGANSRLSIGAEIAMPTGDFANGASTGFGGSLRFEMPLMMNLALTGTAGYISFGGKDGGSSSGMIPVQVGGKFYFSEQQKGLYASLDLGVHMYSYTIPGQPAVVVGGVTYQAATADETKTKSYFSYAPALGYHLDNIDLGLRYQLISTEGSSSSYLGLRIAYVFGGK